MILRLERSATAADLARIEQVLEAAGVRSARSPEPERRILAAVDGVPDEVADALAADPAVHEAVRCRGAWRRVDRAFRESPSLVRVGDAVIGGPAPVVVAGPCSVEDERQMQESADIAADAGADILRGGAFKPRTSPYAFQGLGREGLRLLKRAGDRVGLPIVSEIMDASQLDAFVEEGVDCLQVGARNMQNFTLLKAIARARRPVMLKRGLSATLEEWLQSAEYLAAHGAEDIVLCERGIRTFERATRNTLDLTVLPLLRQWTHLPVMVDPSHAAGIASLIPALSRAAIAAGADGIAVEAHPRPAEARSDGAQALLAGELATIVGEARVLSAVLA